MYAPYVQSRLVQGGMSPAEAVKALRDRTTHAEHVLSQEVGVRPVIYSRAPAWHKFNCLAGHPKLIDGHTIMINGLVGTGLNADHDGDESIGQVLACMTPKTMKQCGVSPSSRVMHSTKNNIPVLKGHDLYLFDLEDFPHGELQRTIQGKNGPIDFHHGAPGVKVLSYDETKNTLAWQEVKFWSKHYAREIEIVDTHNEYQIITDDDPRAVYGIDAIEFKFKRYTPSEALEKHAMIPRMHRVPDIGPVVFEVPGKNDVALTKDGGAVRGSPSIVAMPTTVKLDAEIGWAIGAFAGDGWVTRSYGKDIRINFADSIGDLEARFYEIVSGKLCFGFPTNRNVVERSVATAGSFGATNSYRYTGKNLALWFREMVGGVQTEEESGSRSKRLPTFFLQTPREFRNGLLAGLLDTDGSVSVVKAKSKNREGLTVFLTSTSLRLCREAKLLAMSLGIRATVSTTKTPKGLPCWITNFSVTDIVKWEGQHLLAQKTKKAALAKGATIPDKNSGAAMKSDLIPVSVELAEFFRKEIGSPKQTGSIQATLTTAQRLARKDRSNLYTSFWGLVKHKTFTMSRVCAQRAVELAGRHKIEAHPHGKLWLSFVDNTDITWERVVGVQKTGIREDGYDLTIPGYDTFANSEGLILSNTINIHVPSMDDAVAEAHEKLMPSKMLFSDREYDKTLAVPKHESILGLSAATYRPAKITHQFPTRAAAMAGVKSGKVKLEDEVKFPGSD